LLEGGDQLVELHLEDVNMDSDGAISMCQAFEAGACPLLRVLRVDATQGAEWERVFSLSPRRQKYVDLQFRGTYEPWTDDD